MRITFQFAFFFILLFLGNAIISVSGDSAPIVDGVVLRDEYLLQIEVQNTNVEVYTYSNETHLWVGLRTSNLGWIGIGFEPEAPFHQGTNFIIGYVENGQLSIQDAYGLGDIGHVSDEILGGFDDILESAGSESEGNTTIEFMIPLDSGDQYDKPLELNQTYTIIVASHATADDFISWHTEAGTAEIQIIPEFPSILLTSIYVAATIISVFFSRKLRSS